MVVAPSFQTASSTNNHARHHNSNSTAGDDIDSSALFAHKSKAFLSFSCAATKCLILEPQPILLKLHSNKAT